ncbi:DUF1981-domain-containing protein [Rozella allomycis CSF55]|uniref:DUF1981-domain-containing protein n=1 Tax=Rozella allomycis (strain CSF55) TaxID=988480 RepID=A0A4P9YH58_ROZAC|nr:DUF1981-domain-containing protein [Rozella allomycis CSF55]
MNRIRLEWSNIWNIISNTFTQVACNVNLNIANFSIDSLRQLSFKFLEKEEMSQFKFQKEFLKPFEEIFIKSNLEIKDFVIRCLLVIIQGRGKNIKSGWKSIFNVLSLAALETNENICLLSFDAVKYVCKERLKDLVLNNSFSDLVQSLVSFAKNKKYPKINLQAVELLKSAIPRVAELCRSEHERIENEINSSQNDLILNSYQDEDPSVRFWFPIHFGLYEILMEGDLEVRTRALNYLFDCLKDYGNSYSQRFWSVVYKKVILLIFVDLNKKSPLTTEFKTEWQSTTLVQALRNVINLFSFFFDDIHFLLSDILSLLSLCINQENEALARIGTSCLQQLVENNYKKLDASMWHLICGCIEELVESTMPRDLFQFESRQGDQVDESDIELKELKESSSGELNAIDLPIVSTEKRQLFQSIVIKCILQLLILETINETIVVHKSVYSTMNCDHMVRVLDCLNNSYQTAKAFNMNIKLRLNLLSIGFTKQLPNLLKQETMSITVYLSLINKVYFDQSGYNKPLKSEIEKRFIDLTQDVLTHYSKLDPEYKHKIAAAWKPVVLKVLSIFKNINDDAFVLFVPRLYDSLVRLLDHDLSIETRVELKFILLRIGNLFGIVNKN